MNLRISSGLFRLVRTPQARPFPHCLYRTGNIRFLSTSGTQVVSRYSLKNLPVPWNLLVLLGFGMMGGMSLSVVKYFRADRTSRCQSKAVETCPQLVVSELTVQQFGILRRLYLAMRLLYLCALFSPAVITYALSQALGSKTLAEVSWRYVLFVIQLAGPAFVKLGQWASTRRDIFTDEFCQTLSYLHLRCIPHPWRETEKMLEGNFGPDWHETLNIVNHTPIGSGSGVRGEVVSPQPRRFGRRWCHEL